VFRINPNPALAGNNPSHASHMTTASKPVANTLRIPNDSLIDNVLTDIGKAVFPTARKFNQVTDPSGHWLISTGSVAKPQLEPRTIPLYIALGAHLTNPAELACARAVAQHLSNECSRAVEVSELKGLVLYLWSEDDPDGKELNEYLEGNRRPLQALLLESRQIAEADDHIARAELVPFVGQRFEIVAFN
jgi:hypothetical protein